MDIERMLDNAATCCQDRALLNEVVRECIKLNVHGPMAQRIAELERERDALSDALKARIVTREEKARAEERERCRDAARKELIGFFNEGGNGESLSMADAQECLRNVDAAIRALGGDE